MKARYLLLFFISCLVSCSRIDCHCRGEEIPDFVIAPDYADSTMWYINIEDTADTTVDVFYICSTETADWQDSTGSVVHYADMFNTNHRTALSGEMQGVNERIRGVNFYSPYYRQATIEALLADTAYFICRSLAACEDVFRAFDYYLKNYNHGRPFVLMGYSQGALDVIQLQLNMPDSIASRMVAAYVIGYKVTASDLKNKHVVPATGDDDVGVTICYNSVLSTDCEVQVISKGTQVGINPVNWATDNTPAVFADTLTATLDVESHLVCISGYSGPNKPIPFVGVEGNYHTQEIRFYGPALQENVLLRAKRWREIGKNQ